MSTEPRHAEQLAATQSSNKLRRHWWLAMAGRDAAYWAIHLLASSGIAVQRSFTIKLGPFSICTTAILSYVQPLDFSLLIVRHQGLERLAWLDCNPRLISMSGLFRLNVTDALRRNSGLPTPSAVELFPASSNILSVADTISLL